MSNPLKAATTYFDNREEVPATGIVLREEVRNLCEMNSCGSFGRNWTCPPAVAPLDAIRDRLAAFDTLLIVYQVYPIGSSFDWKAMKAGAADFKGRLQRMKREVELAHPTAPSLVLGSGACNLCEPCAYVDGEPCRRPDDAIVSLEACGVDVMRLMRDHRLPYYNGKGTVTFIGGVFYNKPAEPRRDRKFQEADQNFTAQFRKHEG